MTIVFALYTGDFRRSLRNEASRISGWPGPLAQRRLPAPLTMCIKESDTAVATLWGWDDREIPRFPPDGEFGTIDSVRRGVTRALPGPRFDPGVHEEASPDMSVRFEVRVGGRDADGDGLGDTCGEPFYRTSTSDPDSDDDGLTDGDEVNVHETDPSDPDSDDDGLTDGDEVNARGTDPSHADSDYDGLTDGDEANVHGTDPLNADNDDDGVVDGQDVDFVTRTVERVPDTHFRLEGGGTKTALLDKLHQVEALLLAGTRDQAIGTLRDIRLRLDGCGLLAHIDDWIHNCQSQVAIRGLVDQLIANVTQQEILCFGKPPTKRGDLATTG